MRTGFAKIVWNDGCEQYGNGVQDVLFRANQNEPEFSFRYVTLGWETGAVLQTPAGVQFSAVAVIDTFEQGKVVAVLFQF